MMSALISFSDAAKAEIMGYVGSDTLPEGYLLRIGVRGGACSANYFIGLDKPTDQDDVIDSQGIRVLVDRRQVLYVAGLWVDFEAAEQGGGFSFEKNVS
jgi:iron-sulfur cluster assembly protein